MSWPGIPFMESMIDEAYKNGKGLIIFCPEEETVADLFEILEKNGVGWIDGTPMKNTQWYANERWTCYRILPASLLMKRGDVDCYSGYEYRDHIKCTFYGVEEQDGISEDLFKEIICAGGVSKGGKAHVGSAV